jgi:hypothetical protein
MSTTSEERISGADVLFLGYSVLIFFVRGTRFFCTETRSFGFTLFRLSFLIIAFLVFRLSTYVIFFVLRLFDDPHYFNCAVIFLLFTTLSVLTLGHLSPDCADTSILYTLLRVLRNGRECMD